MKSHNPSLAKQFKERFRGFLPVVVDLETAGVNPQKSALLEVCMVLIEMDEEGLMSRGKTHFEHVLPYPGTELDEKSLAFNKIDPYQPLRFAIEEGEALKNLFQKIEEAVSRYRCQRAVLVGHNAWFDLLFLKQACYRNKIKSPFHAFTCFDTATLGGLFYGQTVLAKAAKAAKIAFDPEEAHSAIYDAEKTADLYCQMMNQWREMNLPK